MARALWDQDRNQSRQLVRQARKLLVDKPSAAALLAEVDAWIAARDRRRD